MWKVTRILARNRTVVVLFVLMVLLPASIFSVLTIRAFRSERLRTEYEKAQRQRQIVRLAAADLINWLFATGPQSAGSRAFLTFRIQDDQISFPGFPVSLPNSAGPERQPLATTPSEAPPSVESISSYYYPRIRAFLRDFSAGRNSGAQYFLRLKALVVRAPNRDDGYVLAAQPLVDYVNTRLTEFSAAEQFTASLWIGDAENRSPGNTDAVPLDGFPFFHVIFHDTPATGAAAFGAHSVTSSMTLLGVVMVLGTLFAYRAVSREVQLSRLRSDFVAAVSHEFRSPLSSILALSERLESLRVTDREKLADYHRLIGQDARRLGVLVSRLLDFAQIEEGQKVYSRERVDLVASARQAVQSCRHSVRPDRLAFAGDEASPLWVLADSTALHHCIQNLIDNALKYSPADAPVLVTCALENGAALVDVRDYGIGIDPTDKQRIFEKFYRGRQASGLDVQGVGIGLALVKHVAESHDGVISVESQPGHGSRFRLALPRMES